MLKSAKFLIRLPGLCLCVSACSLCKTFKNNQLNLDTDSQQEVSSYLPKKLPPEIFFHEKIFSYNEKSDLKDKKKTLPFLGCYFNIYILNFKSVL